MPADIISSDIHALAGRSALADGVMRFAVQYLIFGVVLVLIALWVHEAGLRAGLAAAIGALVALGIGAVIGSAWDEARPFVAEHFTPLVAHGADASFPSDHLLTLGGITGAIWCAARRLAIAVLVLSTVVAFARVYAGIHYAGDVTAGFLIGFGCGVLAWRALRLAAPLVDCVDLQLRAWHLRPILLGRADA